MQGYAYKPENDNQLFRIKHTVLHECVARCSLISNCDVVVLQYVDGSCYGMRWGGAAELVKDAHCDIFTKGDMRQGFQVIPVVQNMNYNRGADLFVLNFSSVEACKQRCRQHQNCNLVVVNQAIKHNAWKTW